MHSRGVSVGEAGSTAYNKSMENAVYLVAMRNASLIAVCPLYTALCFEEYLSEQGVKTHVKITSQLRQKRCLVNVKNKKPENVKCS